MRPHNCLSLALILPLMIALSFGAALLAAVPCLARAGWDPDKQISYTSGRSGLSPSNAKCIAFDSSGTVHAVWHDDVPGNYEIMYLRFDTLTVFPSELRRITWNAGVSLDPSVALLEDGSVFVTWTEDSDSPVSVIDFSRFFPDTASLADSGRVPSDQGTCSGSSVAAGPDTSAHVVWIQETNQHFDVFYRKWHFGWVGEPVNLSESAGLCGSPCVDVDGLGRVHATWSDNVTGSNEIYYRRFAEASGWTPVTRVSFSYKLAWSPSVAADGEGNAYVVWSDKRDGYFDIYFRRYVEGIGWGDEKRLTSNMAVSANPSATTDCDGNLHVVWEDYRDGNDEIYYKRVTTGQGPGWDPVDTRLTNNIFTSWDPSVVADCAGNVHVLWADNRSSNFEIYYKLGIAPVPVSVELLDFHAECTADGVLLKWETVSDSPLAFFDVFREEESEGVLRKLTDTSLFGSTEFKDTSAQQGRSYFYYLGVWEGEGTDETMFGPLAVTFNPPAVPVARTLLVWPNPSRGVLNIAFRSGQAGAAFRLSLYDVRGRFVREVASGKTAGDTFSLSWEFPRSLRSENLQGIYIVCLELAGKRFDRKVLLLGGEGN